MGSSGDRLYVVRDEIDPQTDRVTTVKIKRLVSSAATLQAAQEAKTTGTYLWLEQPDSTRLKDIRNLKRARNNVATGLEVQTTRTLASDRNAAKAFGPLAALNDAHSVTFLDKDGIDLLEVDGICVSSQLVVMNEVKATPSLYDVEELIKRGRLLSLLLASPDDYVTKPAEVKEKLEKCRDVRLALSGYNFQEQVQAQAWKKQMWVIRTNGEAFEARGPNSLSSHGS